MSTPSTNVHGDQVASVRIVIVTSDDYDMSARKFSPKGKHYGFKAGKLIKYPVKGDLCKARITSDEVFDVTDMSGIMAHLHNRSNREVLLNALPPDGATTLVTKNQYTNEPDRFTKTKVHLSYPTHPHHGYFDVDWEPYYGSMPPIEDIVRDFRRVCREFQHVTLGASVSASSCIHAPDGTELRGRMGWRLRYIVDDGSHIFRIHQSVCIRLAEAGFRYIKHYSNRDEAKTLFDEKTATEDRCDYIGAPHLEDGLSQRKPEPMVFEGSQAMVRAGDVPDESTQKFSEWRHSDPVFRQMMNKPEVINERKKQVEHWIDETAKKTNRTREAIRTQHDGKYWDEDQEFTFANGETISIASLILLGDIDEYVDSYCNDPNEPERGVGVAKLGRRGFDLYIYSFHFMNETPIQLSDVSIASLSATMLPDNVVQFQPRARTVVELMPMLAQNFTQIAVALGSSGRPLEPVARALVSKAGLSAPEAVAMLCASPIGAGQSDIHRIVGEAVAAHELGDLSKQTTPFKLIPQSLGAIMRADYPEPQWIVEGLIPEGTTLFAGRPKKGKSWAMFDLAIEVARGGMFLGKQCVQGDVLYMALEDPRRRIKKRARLLMLMDDDPVLEHIDILTVDDRLPVFGAGLEDALRAALEKKPYRLIIVDTLKKVRPTENGKKGAYEVDYDAVQHLQTITAGIEGLGIVIVHHTRKMDAVDPFDTLSGSTGLTGASDTNIVLYWDQENNCMVLTGQGRDVEDFSFAVTFDKGLYRWTVHGAPDEVGLSETRKKILAVLREGARPMSPSEIADVSKLPIASVKMRLAGMVEAQFVVKEGRGQYILGSRAAEASDDAARRYMPELNNLDDGIEQKHARDEAARAYIRSLWVHLNNAQRAHGNAVRFGETKTPEAVARVAEEITKAEGALKSVRGMLAQAHEHDVADHPQFTKAVEKLATLEDMMNGAEC